MAKEKDNNANTKTFLLRVDAEWPTFDESKMIDDEIEVVVQVLGKVRAKVKVAKDISKEELEKVALEDSRVQEFIEGKTVVKVIVIPSKLVNIVVK